MEINLKLFIVINKLRIKRKFIKISKSSYLVFLKYLFKNSFPIKYCMPFKIVINMFNKHRFIVSVKYKLCY